MQLNSRADVYRKVSWEGGLTAALEYGLTADDMPEGDDELREQWTKMRETWLIAVEHFSRVENILAGRGNIATYP